MRSLLLVFLSVGALFAQENVSGLVVDIDGRPIQNAVVQAPELGIQTQSNANGTFVLELATAALLSVSAENFDTYVTQVNPGDQLTVTLEASISQVGINTISNALSLIELSDDELSED
ncbi:MAG: hypothetical protein GWP32_08085, partial [Bacteroidetes bacterium]|nr:hypothetical protein [Bacteroidota bacterium]